MIQTQTETTQAAGSFGEAEGQVTIDYLGSLSVSVNGVTQS